MADSSGDNKGVENAGISEDDIREAMDAEVKRVSDLFRFIMKYKRHFQPSGVEFSGLRQYLPSDDASRIDWKNSAATPDLYVKQYEEEINMDVFIILDVSDTMTFGTADKLKSEYAAVVAAALTYASVDASIDTGFGMWGEDNIFITPKGGNEQYQRVLHEVTKVENYGGSFDLEEALNDVIGQIKKNTAIFIISDFIDVGGEWKDKLRLASMKFRHVMSVMVRDLRDYEMPESGNMRFESPSGGDTTVVHTDRMKRRFDRAAEKQEKKLEDKIDGSGASFLKIDTRDDFSAAFAEYFDNNEEKW